MGNQVKPPTVGSVLRPALRLRGVSPPSARKGQHSERTCPPLGRPLVQFAEHVLACFQPDHHVTEAVTMAPRLLRSPQPRLEC